MSSLYRAMEGLEQGDPVCLVPGNPGVVVKATVEALLQARAVLGVALADAAPSETVRVGDSGAIPPDSWDPAGSARVGVGNLIAARNGKCERVTTPLPSSDYVIGILRDDGTLVIQRDYELTLATHRMINVKDFGAIGDGSTDDAPAFAAALEALPRSDAASSISTVFYIPPGVYRLSQDLELHREVHLLGSDGAAGNGGCQLVFDEGCGIIVHSHFSTPVPGEHANGCVIEGLRIRGKPPRGVRGGVRQSGLPERWQPQTDYALGDRVCAYRPEADGSIQGYRYFYWECVNAGRSGAEPPDIWSYPPIPSLSFKFAAHRAHIPDQTLEWRPATRYYQGQTIRAPGNLDAIFVMGNSTDNRSGATPPDWSSGAEIDDNGILWVRRDASPYFLTEPGGLTWSCRVHAGIRAHMYCEIKQCMIERFLNAGIWIGAGNGWYPLGNAIGWRIGATNILNCGTGICVQGDNAHQGITQSVMVVAAGGASELGTVPIDWSTSDQGGNGGISICDLSYYGNQWASCTNEYATDRGLVCEGIRNGSVISLFWDEGTASGGGPYLSGTATVIGGWFNRGFDPQSVHAAVRMRDFRQVEEVNVLAPRNTRAMLHMQGADSVFLWKANNGYPASDYSNTTGWRHSSIVPSFHGENHAWVFSYQNNSPHPYFAVNDGFSAVGAAWQDIIGHFNGWPGSEYFLGTSWDAEYTQTVRRGLREVGDRFESRLNPKLPRGRFLGRVAISKGFRSRNKWAQGVNWSAFSDSFGWAASTIEVDGFVFICTRSGPSGDTQPDFATAIQNRSDPTRAPLLSPIFSAAKILNTWIPDAVQQVGMLKRPTHRAADGSYYHYQCEQVAGRGRTASVEPAWPTNLNELIEDNEVTWKCLGPDPDEACIVEEASGLQWTCMGPVAEFAPYGPIYEKASTTTTGDAWEKLDEYLVPLRSCTQYDVVVTAVDQAAPPAVAAAFTLRAACFHNGSAPAVLGNVDIDRRGNTPDIDADLRLEVIASGWYMRLYVRGLPGISIRWQSMRRPHTDSDWS